MPGIGASSSGDASSAPPQNPIGDAFKRWSARTPPVTRYVILMLACFWIVTFILPSAAFTNVAIHLIYELEVYRLLLASFVPSGLLGFALSAYWFSGMGAQLERARGSVGLLALVGLFVPCVNVGWPVAVLRGTPDKQRKRCVCTATAWVLIAAQCSASP